jgi:thioredoxin 1
LAPILEKISQDKADKLTLIAIDSDENPELCQAKKIESIPFLELYKDGKLVWEHKGFITEADLLKATGL